MTDVLIVAMPGETAPAKRLADAMAAGFSEIDVHHFPDGESRVRAPSAAETTIVYNSLDHPNEKLIELGLAASALRDIGAERLVLVAPYLCYMRQDTAFHPGEAVSQRVIGRLLSGWFDRVVTIEPHLHRTKSLSDVFLDTETTALSAGPLLAEMIKSDEVDPDKVLIVGPDMESRPWTEEVATAAGAPFVVLAKDRRGDRDVSIMLDDDSMVAGRNAYLVDDIASSGATLAVAARLLTEKGAVRVEAAIAHALFDGAAFDRMRAAGIARVRSTDSIAHPSNAVEVAPMIAKALAKESAA